MAPDGVWGEPPLFGGSSRGLRTRRQSDDILFFTVARKSNSAASRRPPRSARRAGTAPAWGAAQWAALRSPARFELYTLAEGAAPCSISDLARLSGRRASSLYRHVAALERAKFLVATDQRRAGRRFETVYALGPMAAAPSVGPSPSRVVPQIIRMVERAFRSAGRDVAAALRAGHLPRHRDPATPLSFFFEVTWLDDRRRRELYALMRKITAIVAEGRVKRTGELHRIVSSMSPLGRGV